MNTIHDFHAQEKTVQEIAQELHISLRNPWESDISRKVTIIALVHFARKG